LCRPLLGLAASSQWSVIPFQHVSFSAFQRLVCRFT
jgi:hypothetical protein